MSSFFLFLPCAESTTGLPFAALHGTSRRGPTSTGRATTGRSGRWRRSCGCRCSTACPPATRVRTVPSMLPLADVLLQGQRRTCSTSAARGARRARGVDCAARERQPMPCLGSRSKRAAIGQPKALRIPLWLRGRPLKAKLECHGNRSRVDDALQIMRWSSRSF